MDSGLWESSINSCENKIMGTVGMYSIEKRDYWPHEKRALTMEAIECFTTKIMHFFLPASSAFIVCTHMRTLALSSQKGNCGNIT